MLFRKKKINRKVNVVAIGGGSGLFSLLTGLKEYSNLLNIKAIVSTLDSGGSSGKLRTQYGILPPGDIRNCIVALSNQTKTMIDLFQFRFDKKLKEHNFGNLLITALTQITGSFDKAVSEASKILNIKGEVIPVSLEQNTLIAKTKKGEIIEGEALIDTIIDKKIENVYLKEKPKTNKKAIKALIEADFIILGPGDLYTSILPNILFPNIRLAIKGNNKAKKILITPVMTKPGETDNFRVSDFVFEVEKYLKFKINYVVSNSQFPASNSLVKYQKEKKYPVLIDEDNIKDVKLIKAPFIDEKELLRHNPQKLAKTILKIIN